MNEKIAANSLLVGTLRRELAKRRGDFAEIAASAGVKIGWLHACMKSSYETRDLGVRKVEATLKALGFTVSVDGQ